MNNTKLCKIPPLTPDDIQTLRGKPAVKLTYPKKVSNMPPKQEWIYISPIAGEERYFFNNGCLVGWRRDKI
ncbi:MAG: hypothetical protein HY811_04030 [Planctomycetes bacterium]|nr:hypothetical protein [Planctomycetota bacterium]